MGLRRLRGGAMRRLRPLLLLLGALLAASVANCFVSALAPGLQGRLAWQQRRGGHPRCPTTQVAASIRGDGGYEDNDGGSKDVEPANKGSENTPFKGGIPADTIVAIGAVFAFGIFLLAFLGQ
mmetsp:Transcript_87935/g.188630  ORF Transcript_87935/g.188630 Transcript_87935/m.188630 type:complete len:123 (-) Transcript_87935:111-479(-)